MEQFTEDTDWQQRKENVFRQQSKEDIYSNKLLVAAIDFGTTYSGYAFSFRHDYERDPLKISTNTAWSSSAGKVIG